MAETTDEHALPAASSGPQPHQTITEDARVAALRAGPAPIPQKFIRWIIVGFAVLGLGGVIGDKLIGSGSASTPAALAENTGGNNGVPTSIPAPPTPTPVPGPNLSAPLSAFLGLETLHSTTVPRINLIAESGRPWSLSQVRGKIAIVTFANAECNDSCSVLASEVSAADSRLGSAAKNVTFIVVNSDPLETSTSPSPPLLTNTAFGTLSNVTYLTGTVKQLSAVWSRYGVAVEVQPTTRTVAHNDIMYFIDARGKMRYRVTPFANESSGGIFSLDHSDILRFAQGIAHVVALITGRS